MKKVFVSLLVFVFAQAVQAAIIVELDEWPSKNLYNILASYGLRTPSEPDLRTFELARNVFCKKIVNSGVHYECQLYDQLHSASVTKTGWLAKRLYDVLVDYNGEYCTDDCRTGAPWIECTYWWPDKANPPPRDYVCKIMQIPNLK